MSAGIESSEVRPGVTSENYRFLPTPIEPPPAGNPPSNSEKSGDSSIPGVPADLSSRKRLAVSLMVCGGTLSAVAARVGVSPKTLYNWRQEPAFAAELQRCSVEALEATATRARGLLLKSTHVLSESLNSRERFNWALKLVNANRLWLMAQTLPALPSQDDRTPADACSC